MSDDATGPAQTSGAAERERILVCDDDPRMRETIVLRARRGAAVLLSSHLLHLVEEVCTRVIIMNRGQKIADGTVADLATRVDLAAAGSNLEQIFLRVTGRGEGA